ncbi:MAG TPA: hypothetical protein PLK55_01405 [archaeon]|nr:hypothetical protein [archaeon]
MPDKYKKFKVSTENPGEIYSSISVDSRDFSKPSDKLTKRTSDKYVTLCKKIYQKFPSLGVNGKYNEEYQKAIDFLDWDLTAEEYTATTKLVLFGGLFITLFISGLSYAFLYTILSEAFGNSMMALFLIFGLPAVIFIFVFLSFQKYPLKKVADEKIKALTFVPEILGYMIMSMKLVPNLEKAIEFASEHGHGKIAEDLKKLLWEVKVGIKNSVAEGLDDLAYRWGDISIELKKGLMKIRASVIESSESKRYQLLDQTMSETLESVKGKLEDYARTLNQPATIMFYLGILLPLLLIIVLPVGSAFSGSALAQPIYLILIYNVIIPLACFFYAQGVIKKRPPTYNPPNIPYDFPGLPKKNHLRVKNAQINVFIIIAILLVSCAVIGFTLQNAYGVTREKILEREQGTTTPNWDCTREERQQQLLDPAFICADERNFWQDPKNSITPYYLIFFILFAVAASISLWAYATSVYKRKIQLATENQEKEFKDALYIIASRLGENKPIEDAFEHTRRFLPKSTVAKDIFGKTVDNIRVLGLTLQSAVFDRNYGALKNNPSRIITSAMQLVVDSVQMGVNVAAKTLISYSMQLRNTDEINRLLSILIAEITGTLNSMAKFIGPIILGVTTTLHKVVISTLASVASSGAIQDMTQSLEGINTAELGMDLTSVSSFGTAINVEVIGKLASATSFTIIVAIYLIEIVLIMTYFTTMIEQENMTLVKYRISQTLPVAVILFIITVILANMVL